MVKRPKLTVNRSGADDWVKQEGVDLEVAKTKKPSYPHRISLDLDDKLYERLKAASFFKRVSMNQIIRELLEGASFD